MIWLFAIPAFAYIAFCLVMAASERARLAFIAWLDQRAES